MKTKNILLLVFIFARIQVFFADFLSALILAMNQDQALVASKHLLVETEDAGGCFFLLHFYHRKGNTSLGKKYFLSGIARKDHCGVLIIKSL